MVDSAFENQERLIGDLSRRTRGKTKEGGSKVNTNQRYCGALLRSTFSSRAIFKAKLQIVAQILIFEYL